jgi:uncharacterized FlaG/YvyC family protein
LLRLAPAQYLWPDPEFDPSELSIGWVLVEWERDETSGTNIIRVVDDRTGEVIRQMPPDELLNFMRNLTKMLGNFIDEKV